MSKILFIGAGGHARSVADSIRDHEDFELVGFLDNNMSLPHGPLELPILGPTNAIEEHKDKGIDYVFIAIGTNGKLAIRKKLAEMAESADFSFPVIIDKTAIVSSDVKVGEGTFIAKGAIVNTGAKIGKHVIINSGAIVEHDCVIGDYSYIAPGVVMGGFSQVGDESHISIGTKIKAQSQIGSNTIVCPGSIVMGDIPDNVVADGTPCKVIEIRE